MNGGGGVCVCVCLCVCVCVCLCVCAHSPLQILQKARLKNTNQRSHLDHKNSKIRNNLDAPREKWSVEGDVSSQELQVSRTASLAPLAFQGASMCSASASTTAARAIAGTTRRGHDES
jgi:hypothetical protein